MFAQSEGRKWPCRQTVTCCGRTPAPTNWRVLNLGNEWTIVIENDLEWTTQLKKRSILHIDWWRNVSINSVRNEPFNHQPCACWLPNTNTKVTFRVPNRWYCWSQGAAASTIQVILSYSLDPSVDPVSNASMHVVLGLSLQVRKVTPQQNIQPWVSTLIWNDETWEYIYVIVTLQIVRTTFFNLAWSNCSHPKPPVSNLPFRKAQ